MARWYYFTKLCRW